MRSGFNANVPARKPRTQIGRVLSELTTAAQDSDANGAAATELRPAPDSPRAPGEVGALPEHFAPVTVAETVARSVSAAVPSRGASGRERLEQLRERLALAAQPVSEAGEPKRTAAAVREVVEGMRARLEAAARERSELVGALEAARAELSRVQAELQREKKARAALEARAEERRRIADEAVAEAEALAAERDQILAELTEQRRLEDEQNAFLAEAEASIAQRVAEREAAARELAEAQGLLNVRAAEVADLQLRLAAEAAERARVEARCRELEAETQRLVEASAALEAIEALVTQGALRTTAR